MDPKELLKSIQARQAPYHYGIGLASAYVGGIAQCFAGGPCPEKLFNMQSPAAWEVAIKAAEGQLVYADEDMGIVKRETGSAITKGACLDFECVVTTVKQDRDRDILETAGATLDTRSPLLWQHISFEPIGRLLRQKSQTTKKLMAKMSVLDSELGRDAAQLIEFDALRISHGFIPSMWEPLEKPKNDQDMRGVGYRVKKFEIVEVSVVSVPSNTDAIITAFSRGKLFHPAVKQWAGGYYEQRPATVKGGFEGKQECTCGAKNAEVPKPDEKPEPKAPANACPACGCTDLMCQDCGSMSHASADDVRAKPSCAACGSMNMKCNSCEWAAGKSAKISKRNLAKLEEAMHFFDTLGQDEDMKSQSRTLLNAGKKKVAEVIEDVRRQEEDGKEPAPEVKEPTQDELHTKFLEMARSNPSICEALLCSLEVLKQDHQAQAEQRQWAETAELLGV